jgi:hypothetical protein
VALVSWKSLGNHNYTGLFKGVRCDLSQA